MLRTKKKQKVSHRSVRTTPMPRGALLGKPEQVSKQAAAESENVHTVVGRLVAFEGSHAWRNERIK